MNVVEAAPIHRDVDVAVAVPDHASAEALVRSLLANGYQLLASVEHANGRLATARLSSAVADRNDQVVVDVLFASSVSSLRSSKRPSQSRYSPA